MLLLLMYAIVTVVDCKDLKTQKWDYGTNKTEQLHTTVLRMCVYQRQGII